MKYNIIYIIYLKIYTKLYIHLYYLYIKQLNNL